MLIEIEHDGIVGTYRAADIEYIEDVGDARWVYVAHKLFPLTTETTYDELVSRWRIALKPDSVTIGAAPDGRAFLKRLRGGVTLGD